MCYNPTVIRNIDPHHPILHELNAVSTIPVAMARQRECQDAVHHKPIDFDLELRVYKLISVGCGGLFSAFCCVGGVVGIIFAPAFGFMTVFSVGDYFKMLQLKKQYKSDLPK